jgi:hypothetical protein
MPVTVRNADILFNDNSTQTSAAVVLAAGTAMMFVQTNAPTGWTKSTAHNDKALRVVSGTAGSGGSAAFTTAFGAPSVSGTVSGTVGNHTLTTAQIPSHSHGAGSSYSFQANTQYSNVTLRRDNTNSPNTSSVGGGGAHNHSFSGSISSATAGINVQYVDVIIATKA